MKNRKREICTSGTVGGEGGNILTYPADPAGSCADPGFRGEAALARAPLNPGYGLRWVTSLMLL